MVLSYATSQTIDDYIVTPAPASSKSNINLTSDQQKWLHFYYTKKMPEI